MRVWLQNEYLATVLYWQKRGETDTEGGLAQAVFRNKYMARWYDTSVVWDGPPKPVGRGQTEQSLRADGLVGIYAERL